MMVALGSFLKPSFEVNKRTRLAGGVSSGVVSTVAALGGTPLALVYQDRSGAELRSTLAISFVVAYASWDNASESVLPGHSDRSRYVRNAGSNALASLPTLPKYSGQALVYRSVRQSYAGRCWNKLLCRKSDTNFAQPPASRGSSYAGKSLKVARPNREFSLLPLVPPGRIPRPDPGSWISPSPTPPARWPPQAGGGPRLCAPRSSRAPLVSREHR